eukprot:TRINITY_DN10698_c0_g1_i1.p1 TRINITY_DN10698_c0_g1~~TRINITY_DN10698_c0_g1_i1.p1  ORF type:complete len:138 (-),score=21.33 TRINITY_DN10698_c0_g1_i1:19-432(-)
MCIRDRYQRRVRGTKKKMSLRTRTGQASFFEPRTGPNENSSQQLLERETDHQLQGISAKLSSIQNLANAIGHEIKLGSNVLDDMESQVSTTQSLLQQNMARLKRLADQSTSRHMIYLGLFFVAVIFFLYYFLSLIHI